MDTILAAVLTIGALTIGAIVRLSWQQGNFHGLMKNFMEATNRRLARLEQKGDDRDARNEQRRANGG
jgi:hypothetical protein